MHNTTPCDVGIGYASLSRGRNRIRATNTMTNFSFFYPVRAQPSVSSLELRSLVDNTRESSKLFWFRSEISSERTSCPVRPNAPPVFRNPCRLIDSMVVKDVPKLYVHTMILPTRTIQHLATSQARLWDGGCEGWVVSLTLPIRYLCHGC